MKIEQSAVSMNADHRLTSEYEARLESRSENRRRVAKRIARLVS